MTISTVFLCAHIRDLLEDTYEILASILFQYYLRGRLIDAVFERIKCV